MRISWRDDKAQRNKRKHGLDFGLADKIFADPFLVTQFDRIVDGEERWHALGAIAVGGLFKVFLVVHSFPDPEDQTHVQIISLRSATNQERREYEDPRNRS